VFTLWSFALGILPVRVSVFPRLHTIGLGVTAALFDKSFPSFFSLNLAYPCSPRPFSTAVFFDFTSFSLDARRSARLPTFLFCCPFASFPLRLRYLDFAESKSRRPFLQVFLCLQIFCSSFSRSLSPKLISLPRRPLAPPVSLGLVPSSLRVFLLGSSSYPLAPHPVPV